jgi:hypothetical protein
VDRSNCSNRCEKFRTELGLESIRQCAYLGFRFEVIFRQVWLEFPTCLKLRFVLEVHVLRAQIAGSQRGGLTGFAVFEFAVFLVTPGHAEFNRKFSLEIEVLA